MAPAERMKKRTRSATAMTQKSEAVTKKRKIAKEPSPVQEEGENEQSEDDQTVAFLKGFESSEDEGPDAEDFKQGQVVPNIPTDTKVRKKLDKAKRREAEAQPGVIYVGRIPHGFYEHEMRSYFSQFGDITRLRLSRNRKTGQSKHYAFVEFNSSEVAQIVADTMNNYLMFGHILKCKTIPSGQIHENLWKGANKRFKKVPWNKLEGRRLEMARTRDTWEKKVEKEMQKRALKQEKLKAIGYEFQAPRLTRVEDLPVRDAVKLISDTAETSEGSSGLTTIGAVSATAISPGELDGVVISEVTKTVDLGKKSRKTKGKKGNSTQA